MIKKEVSPYDLVPNMKIAETILNDYGSVVIMENTVLDEYLIKNFKIRIFQKLKFLKKRPISL